MTGIEQIKTNFEKQLAAISTANGYSTNLGAHVFEWFDRVTLDAQDLPAVVYREGTQNRVEDDSFGAHMYLLGLEAHLFVEGPQSAKDLPRLCRDVVKAVGTDQTLGGSCISIEIDGIDRHYEHAEHITGDAVVRFVAQYRVAEWEL